jgi:hypothetical protein
MLSARAVAVRLGRLPTVLAGIAAEAVVYPPGKVGFATAAASVNAMGGSNTMFACRWFQNRQLAHSGFMAFSLVGTAINGLKLSKIVSQGFGRIV